MFGLDEVAALELSVTNRAANDIWAAFGFLRANFFETKALALAALSVFEKRAMENAVKSRKMTEIVPQMPMAKTYEALEMDGMVTD